MTSPKILLMVKTGFEFQYREQSVSLSKLQKGNLEIFIEISAYRYTGRISSEGKTYTFIFLSRSSCIVPNKLIKDKIVKNTVIKIP